MSEAVRLNSTFWRDRLVDDGLRADYDRLLRNYSAHSTMPVGGVFVGKDSGVVGRDIDKLLTAMSMDNPAMNHSPLQCEISGGNGSYTIRPIYPNLEGFDVREFENKTTEIVAQLEQYRGQFERILAVKNFLARNVEYDNEFFDACGASGKCGAETNASATTAYGAIVRGKAVCSGIAKAAALLLRRLGIDCICIGGKSKGKNPIGHLWNIVECDGKNYHLDIASDICQRRLFYRDTYNYFLISNDEMFQTFLYDYSGNVDCETPSEYFTRKNLVFSNLEKLRQFLYNAPHNGAIMFRYIGGAEQKYIEELLSDAIKRTKFVGTCPITFANRKYLSILTQNKEQPKKLSTGAQ